MEYVNDCGCKVIQRDNHFTLDIIYCPKHAAAPEMYEALKELVKAYRVDTMPQDETDVDWPVSYWANARRILSEIEGD